MTDLAVYYEHPAWFEPLFRVLDKRGVDYAKIAIQDHIFDPADLSAPAKVVFNRLAMSSFLRQAEHATFYTQALLTHWAAAGARVINGAEALAFDASKARQLTLFRSLGLDTPATRVVHRRADVARAAEGLRFPLMVKVNIGGSGTGMIRYDMMEDLTAYADDGSTPVGVDGVALVQEYVPARDGRVIRCETLAGKFLYAIALDGAGSTFDLCPADVCMVDKTDHHHHRLQSAAGDRPRGGGGGAGGASGRRRRRIHDRRPGRKGALLRHQRPFQLRRQPGADDRL